MLKVHVVYLLYRLSSCGVCLDTISQPSHLPRVHCHKGMVCQRGGEGGEHIYIYTYIYVKTHRLCCRCTDSGGDFLFKNFSDLCWCWAKVSGSGGFRKFVAVEGVCNSLSAWEGTTAYASFLWSCGSSALPYRDGAGEVPFSSLDRTSVCI